MMSDLGDFIKAIDTKNDYEEFIEENGDEIDEVVNDVYSCFKDSFYKGWKKGRENGIKDGGLKIRLEVVINIVKYTDLEDRTILKILDKENEKHWIDFLKETRGKLNK